MRKALFGIVAGVFTVAVGPFLVGIALSGAENQQWGEPVGEAMARFIAVVTSPWWTYTMVVIIGVAVGVTLDWLARRIDGSRRKRLSNLAASMVDMRDRLMQIDYLIANKKDWVAIMTIAYADMIALQHSIEDFGIKVPWVPWEVGTDPSLYLRMNLGFLGLLGPLLRDGHLTSARQASSTYVNWKPIGPGLMLNGEFAGYRKQR